MHDNTTPYFGTISIRNFNCSSATVEGQIMNFNIKDDFAFFITATSDITISQEFFVNYDGSFTATIDNLIPETYYTLSLEIESSFKTITSNPLTLTTLEEHVIFDDNNFEDYCLHHFDIDKDGYVSLKEASLVEELSLDSYTDSYEPIFSLTGIKSFVNLRQLCIEGHPIGSVLDISTLNKLTKLEAACVDEILFGDTSHLTWLHSSMKSIDFSNMPNLQVFFHEYCEINEDNLNNELKKVPMLGSLCLDYTGIHHLDLSNNPQLYFIGVRGNPIETLDVSRCSNEFFIGALNSHLKTIYIRKGQTIYGIDYDCPENVEVVVVD